MAEQDGRLDAAFGGTPAAMTAALRIALREEGTFLDPKIVDIATGQKTIAQSTIALFPPSATLPARSGAPACRQGAYAFYPDADVVLPYLPDPLAIGVSLDGLRPHRRRGLPPAARFPGDWPELQPFRLRLSEGPLGAAFDGGVLRGARCRRRRSCGPGCRRCSPTGGSTTSRSGSGSRRRTARAPWRRRRWPAATGC